MLQQRYNWQSGTFSFIATKAQKVLKNDLKTTFLSLFWRLWIFNNFDDSDSHSDNKNNLGKKNLEYLNQTKEKSHWRNFLFVSSFHLAQGLVHVLKLRRINQ